MFQLSCFVRTDCSGRFREQADSGQREVQSLEPGSRAGSGGAVIAALHTMVARRRPVMRGVFGALGRLPAAMSRSNMWPAMRRQINNSPKFACFLASKQLEEGQTIQVDGSSSSFDLASRKVVN